MIINTMSIQEVRNEIQKEVPYLFRSGEQKAKLLIRTRLKKRLPSIKGSFYVNSPRRTRWLIIIECPKNLPTFFLFIALYKDGVKTKAIQVDTYANGILTVISEHFFHRYAERFGLPSGKMEDVMARYFQRNANFSACRMGEQSTYSFPEGFGLGSFDETTRVNYINTFLSTPMLFENQAIQREAARENFRRFVDANFSDHIPLRKLLTGDDDEAIQIFRPKQAS